MSTLTQPIPINYNPLILYYFRVGFAVNVKNCLSLCHVSDFGPIKTCVLNYIGEFYLDPFN
jgi:hypothetical protein